MPYQLRRPKGRSLCTHGRYEPKSFEREQEMTLIISLVLLPCIAALAMLVAKGDKARDILAIAFAAAIAGLSVAFGFVYLGQGPVTIQLPESWTPVLSIFNLVLDVTVSAFIVAYAAKYKRMLAMALVIVQIILLIVLESGMAGGLHFTSQMHIDALAIIMVLIIGIVGSGICVYGLGYMKDFQAQHPEAKDRRGWFMAVMFAFLSAMYNIVLSDNLGWIYTAWEITTLCSFLLIGFTKEEIAIKNAFRQIVMNMAGGIAFQLAILWAVLNGLPLMFSEFIMTGTAGAAVFAVPTALLAFSAITKAAQMPFHTWLLGAMVAPTPTSALLHSSTMVKAGCFLLIKLAPLFIAFPAAGFMVILTGGITFMFASMMAISQSNAKRVLAYSTIANLGLITACAGVGTAEAIWAAIFLVIFHAVAKSLLFLCVGSAEHQIGSRDIEDMDGLFNRMPRLARFMMLGCLGMFIAPFGMLVSKWATLVSFAATGQVVLLLLLAFGSAATYLFWAKWIGKLTGIAAGSENVELKVHNSEWFAIFLMAALLIVCCVFMPLVSSNFVEAYLTETFGMLGNTLGFDNILITGIAAAFLFVVLFGTLGTVRKKIVPVYLAGITVDKDERTFKGALGDTRQVTLRNWYLDDIFGEKVLDKPATVIASLVLAAGIVGSLVTAFVGSAGIVTLPMYAAVGTVGNGLMRILIGTAVFAVLGPVLGCLLSGADRIISARMQGRVGPPPLQPYYDVRKLLGKDSVAVNSVEGTYVSAALVFTMLSGGAFFGGGNFLLCVFLITLATLFFILAAYSTRSPYAEIGADRECVQVMSYEPIVLFVAVCMFLSLGTFDVAGVMLYNLPMIVTTIPVFIALLFALTIKLRKSPFDLSYGHHAHQELVKGITTEMSGATLAKVEVMHWCETVLFLGWVGMFFVWGNPLSILVGIAVALLTFFLEIVIDNNFARVKWQSMLKWAWIVGGVAGLINIGALVLIAVL